MPLRVVNPFSSFWSEAVSGAGLALAVQHAEHNGITRVII